jgi:hypothetical protein
LTDRTDIILDLSFTRSLLENIVVVVAVAVAVAAAASAMIIIIIIIIKTHTRKLYTIEKPLKKYSIKQSNICMLM